MPSAKRRSSSAPGSRAPEPSSSSASASSASASATASTSSSSSCRAPRTAAEVPAAEAAAALAFPAAALPGGTGGSGGTGSGSGGSGSGSGWVFNAKAARDLAQVRQLGGPLRLWLLEHVCRGSEVLAAIQTGAGRLRFLYDSEGKRRAWNVVSFLGTHDFFMSFFPVLWFVFGQGRLAVQLLNLLAAAIFVGNVAKDYFCLPRPLPPARLGGRHGGVEYGFVSTHSLLSMTAPLYMAHELVDRTQPWGYPLMAMFFMYALVVASSRLWLGMHTPVDIVGGVVMGVILLEVWIWFVAGYIDGVLDSPDPRSLLSPVALAIASFYVHPDPPRYCPCLEDTAVLLGSASGVIVGTWRRVWLYNGELEVHGAGSYSSALMRAVLGTIIMFGSRHVLKLFFNATLPVVFQYVRPPRRWLRAFTPGPHAKGPFPEASAKLQAIQERYRLGHAWDVDIPSRVLSYFFMGAITTEFSYVLFRRFDILS